VTEPIDEYVSTQEERECDATTAAYRALTTLRIKADARRAVAALIVERLAELPSEILTSMDTEGPCAIESYAVAMRGPIIRARIPGIRENLTVARVAISAALPILANVTTDP